MKHLRLKNPSYEYLEAGFSEWLDILGYCTMTVYGMPILIREFLFFLEENDCQNIQRVEQKHYREYFQYISTRGNKRRGGGLSNNYLNKQVQALEKFHEFLAHKGTEIPPVTLGQLRLQKGDITVLTAKEVELLFKATETESGSRKQQILSARDRVILTVFYGCGLRRNEGTNLKTGDINFDTRILHVKHGKNYKERLVPVSKNGIKHLQEWVYNYRTMIVQSKNEDALFIGYTGKPLKSNSLYRRVRLLKQTIDDPELQNKDIGLHTLRHSVATHLLQNGMSLQNIQRFLGHSSLDSTQIYTHLIEKQQ